MTAAILDHTEAHYPNNEGYQIDRIVAEAGGEPAHAALIKLLITPALLSPVGPMKDTRAASSLLFLYPPDIQMLLALVFYDYEGEIYQDFSSQYQVEDRRLPPLKLLQMHQAITRLPLGFTYAQLLSYPTAETYQKLSFLLGIEYTPSASPLISERIIGAFRACNFSSPLDNVYLTIAEDNDRISAVDLMGQRLGYSPTCIGELAAIMERWQLHSYT